MWTARTVPEIRQHVANLRRGRANLPAPTSASDPSPLPGVGFVPTMGALHDGHLSLIDAARQLTGHVIVSIYVNPTQFAPHEDFDAYPRPLDDDLKRCEAAGVAGVFCPDNDEMYPPRVPECSVNVPALASILEGGARPAHFAGVCRVVAKLFNIVQPDLAFFGRKDYQQLKVIEAMAADLMLPVRIIGCPTVRDADGLALSSRNQYLTPPMRRHALGLHKSLEEARALIEEGGETDPAAVEAVMKTILTAHHVAVDYAVVRHPQTLALLDIIEPSLTGGVVALVAGRVGNTRVDSGGETGGETGGSTGGVRLIDNMLIGGGGEGHAG